MKQAAGMGIQQTPTLYVNGEALEGAMPLKNLWTLVDRALLSEGITPPPNELNQPAGSRKCPRNENDCSCEWTGGGSRSHNCSQTACGDQLDGSVRFPASGRPIYAGIAGLRKVETGRVPVSASLRATLRDDTQGDDCCNPDRTQS